MKSVQLLLTSISILILSCNNNPKAVSSGTDAAMSTENSPISCYRYASGGDTIALELLDLGDSLSGTLVYALKEKDENMGVIQGKMINGLLVADYTFNSEGVKSVRQVVFKKVGDDLLEGYGAIMIKGDKAVFRNPDSLSFNEKFKLTRAACK